MNATHAGEYFRAVALNQPVDLPDNDSANTFVDLPPLARHTILLALAAYAFLITVVPLINASSQGMGLAAVAFSNLVYVFALSLPILFWRKEYGWVHPLVFTTLFTLVRVIPEKTPLFLSGMKEHIMLPLMDGDSLNFLLAYGNLVEALGLGALFIGYHCGPRWNGISLPTHEPPNKRVIFVGAFALFVSVLFFFLYVRNFGGIGNHLLNLSRGSGNKLGLDGDDEAFGQYIFFIKLGSVIGLILLTRKARALMNPFLWPVCIYGIAINYLINGKRSTLINGLLLFGVAYILRNKKMPYLRIGILGVFSFFMLGLLGLYRTANWSRTDQASFDFLSGLSVNGVAEVTMDELSDRSGGESTYYPLLARVPHDVDMLWGRTYLEWGLNFIPRILWPDKPRGVDVQAARAFNNVEWGMPCGTAGEAYWNFLLPGVFIVFFAFGSFLRWIGAMLSKNSGSTMAISLYAIVLFNFAPSQNGFRAMIYALFPALLLFFAAGYFQRPAKFFRS